MFADYKYVICHDFADLSQFEKPSPFKAAILAGGLSWGSCFLEHLKSVSSAEHSRNPAHSN